MANANIESDDLIILNDNRNSKILNQHKDLIQLKNLNKQHQATPVTSVHASATNNASAKVTYDDERFFIDERFLTDDLSLMLTLDDHSISAILRAKYEAKNIYVSIFGRIICC